MQVVRLEAPSSQCPLLDLAGDRSSKHLPGEPVQPILTLRVSFPPSLHGKITQSQTTRNLDTCACRPTYGNGEKQTTSLKDQEQDATASLGKAQSVRLYRLAICLARCCLCWERKIEPGPDSQESGERRKPLLC